MCPPSVVMLTTPAASLMFALTISNCAHIYILRMKWVVMRSPTLVVLITPATGIVSIIAPVDATLGECLCHTPLQASPMLPAYRRLSGTL